MLTRKSFLFLILFLSVVNVLCETETLSTRKRRFTRASTTGTTSSPSIDVVADIVVTNDEDVNIIIETLSGETNEASESPVESSPTDAPSPPPPPPVVQVVETVTKKSLRVRNCGERIGDDVPFIALLVHTNPYDTQNSRRTLSKGVLISENFVLTTVSSVYHSESFWTVSSVRLGDFITWNKYANRDKSYSVEIDVEEIYFHKKRDIALIKLKESVNYTDVIRPACLPQSDNYNFKELQTHLCKRSEQSKAPADVTMEFAAPLTTFDCRKFFARKRITISPYEFCVWDETGDDCAGDLATALFTIHNGRLFVVGLRSYAETDEEDIADPTEYPGIYIKVGSYLEWISAVLNADARKNIATKEN
ncbi:melanization protease 1-like [Chironomus tepperi]|uniref:melanization protease 1-like n=1 Tax=Chironomus tepperi TaxID=113505 RepID=UPI00391F40E4